MTNYHDTLAQNYLAVRNRLRGNVTPQKVTLPPRPVTDTTGASTAKPPEPPPRLTLPKGGRLTHIDPRYARAVETARLRLHGANLSKRRQLIVLVVLEDHNLTWADITGPVRRRPLVTARTEIYWELLETGMSIAEIGRICGRDHTTVLHHLKNLPRRMKDE